MSDKTSILFVDDEIFFARGYHEKLTERFDVYFEHRVLEAMNLARNTDKIAAMVLDIMMPAPTEREIQLLSDDGGGRGRHDLIEGGLGTGLWLLDTLADVIVDRPLPVVVLTNRRPDIVASKIAELDDVPEKMVKVCAKLETPAFVLPEILDEHMRRERH